jgi:hypothetical protein
MQRVAALSTIDIAGRLRVGDSDPLATPSIPDKTV